MSSEELTSEELQKVHTSLSKKAGKRLTKEQLKELVDKAQKGVADRIFSEENIKESQSLLKKLGDDIASKCGCNTKYGPVKTRTRAQEKVTADYGGDWYDIKDVVRMTIVAPDLTKMEKVDKYIREVCEPREKRGLIKITVTTAEESLCGYSGLNFVAVLENGRAGEIQVNVPGIMYGQMAAATFKEVVGEAKSKELEKAYGIEGGLGHILYELHRVKPADPNSKKAAELSKEYFAHLRGKPPKPEVAKALQVKIDAFKKEFAKPIAALKH